MQEGSFSGYRVIAKEKISLGSLLIYAGEICNFNKYKKSEDGYIVCCRENYQNFIGVTSKYRGNITRFINHAPTKNNMDDFLVFNSEEIKQSVRYANFSARQTKTSKIDFFVLFADRNIEPGEEILWDYGMMYFKSMNITPALFNLSGELISPTLYKWLNPNISIRLNNKICSIVCNGYEKKHLKSLSEEQMTLSDLIKYERLIAIMIAESNLKQNIFIHSYFFLQLLNSMSEITQSYNLTLDLPEEDNPYIKYVANEDINDALQDKLCVIFNINSRNLNYEVCVIAKTHVSVEVDEHLLYPKEKVVTWKINLNVFLLPLTEIEFILNQNDIEYLLYNDDENEYILIRYSSLFKSLKSEPSTKINNPNTLFHLPQSVIIESNETKTQTENEMSII